MAKFKSIKKIQFRTELVLERSISPYPEELGMYNNTMEFYKNENGYFCIEWIAEAVKGDDEQYALIGIELEGHDVVGYDGVFSLPKEAIKLLQDCGYNTKEVE